MENLPSSSYDIAHHTGTYSHANARTLSAGKYGEWEVKEAEITMLIASSALSQFMPINAQTSEQQTLNFPYKQVSSVTFYLVRILWEKQTTVTVTQCHFFSEYLFLCWHYLSFEGLTYQSFLMDIFPPCDWEWGGHSLCLQLWFQKKQHHADQTTQQSNRASKQPFSHQERGKIHRFKSLDNGPLHEDGFHKIRLQF